MGPRRTDFEDNSFWATVRQARIDIGEARFGERIWIAGMIARSFVSERRQIKQEVSDVCIGATIATSSAHMYVCGLPLDDVLIRAGMICRPHYSEQRALRLK